MIQIYFTLLKYLHLLKIFLTFIIFLILNPFNIFSFVCCDMIEETIEENLDNNTNYLYYIGLVVGGIFMVIGIYTVTTYFFPNLDYWDIYHNNLINNLEQNLTETRSQLRGAKIYIIDKGEYIEHFHLEELDMARIESDILDKYNQRLQ